MSETIERYGYVAVDGDGRAIGFWEDEIPRPETALQVLEEEFLRWRETPGLYRWDWEAEAVVACDPPPPGVPAYQQAIDAHVQATARSRGYNDANSCASYVADPNPAWAAEAAAFIAWRSAVYGAAFTALAAVQAGEMPPPSVEEFVASLPAMVWPA